MTHARVAEEIAREIEAAPQEAAAVRDSARQGDLTLRWVGPAEAAGAVETPAGGVVLAAGAHGEHRLLAPAHRISAGLVDLQQGGLVVHTDAPAGRHRALRLRPGRWRIGRQRELSAGEIVQVAD